MKAIIMVGVGGGIGAIARYLLSVWISQATPHWKFPLGTLAVNLLGCLVAGLVMGFAQRRGFLAEELRLLLVVGLLGGFTTFSAFGLETVGFLRQGEMGVAALYVGLSVLLGLLMLGAGIQAALLGTP